MSEPRSVPVYVVMLHHWKYSDGPFDGENRPVTAFRDRAAAERECERLTAEAEADIERAMRSNGYSEFDEASWKYLVAELRLPVPAEG